MAKGTYKNIDEQDHKTLALWAADCTERVLPYFSEKYPQDKRPGRAIEAARSWARGKMPMNETRAAVFSSHTAARNTDDDASCAAARAAGHAAATGHVASHAPHAAAYALKAVDAAAGTAAANAERERQRHCLPKHLSRLLFPGRNDK